MSAYGKTPPTANSIESITIGSDEDGNQARLLFDQENPKAWVQMPEEDVVDVEEQV
jgi:hypothetical protein